MKNNFIIVFLAIAFFSCGQNVPRKPIVRKTSSFLKESISFNKSLIAEEEKAFESYKSNDSLNSYITSTNGFSYKIEKKSTSNYFPKFGDNLSFTYDVYNLRDEIIYSSKEIGIQKYYVDQQEIVEGLRNGLKLMNEGDVVTFLFPSHKVFGYLGDQKKIEINQPLIYKVQLNKINKKNESN